MKRMTTIYISMALGIGVIGVVLYWISPRCIAIHSYELASDISIGSSLEHQAHAIASQLCQQGDCTPEQFGKSLRALLPVIRHVSVRLTPTQHAQVTIVPYRPSCLINDTHLLLANGLIVGRGVLSAAAEQCLPQVRMDSWDAETGTDALSLRDCIVQLYGIDWQRHRLVWRCAQAILLEDTIDSQFRIMFDVSQVPNIAVRAACGQLHERLSEQGKFGLEAKKRRTLVADVRFHKQIIIRHERGV